MSELLSSAGPFMELLYWEFIVGFIFLTYVYWEVESQIDWPWIKQIKSRFKVAAIGLLYGVIYFIHKDYERAHIYGMVISYLFTFGFHKLLVDTFIGAIQGRIGGFKSIASGFLDMILARSPKSAAQPDQPYAVVEPSDFGQLFEGEKSSKDKAKELGLGILSNILKRK